MDQVQIQLQDESGNWRTYSITNNNDLLIISAMEALKSQYPSRRIRAIDKRGMLLNIL